MPARSETPVAVRSNSVPVPFDPQTFAPLPDSRELLGDPAAMRARFDRDGVLYLRGLLDPERVRRLRGEYFGMFPEGYLRPGTAPVDGILADEPCATPAYGRRGHPAYDLARSDSLREFVDQPALRDLAALLMAAETVVRLPRVIPRHFDHRSGRSSRAHIDHTYMDRGDGRVVTTWVPVGDSPLESGGLVYLEGSHRIPYADLDALRSVTDRPEDRRPLSHDLGWVARQLGRRWLWADYRAGDVAVHGPRIVHAALDNTTPAMRMSIDARFAAGDARLDDRWLRPWSADDGA
jgi:hypothetical protein